MIEEPTHELYLDVWEGQQLLQLLESEVESSGERITNSMQLAELVTPHIQKGTFKRQQRRQSVAWSTNYPITSDWQKERVARVIEHYAIFDERVDTGEPIITWAHGPSSADVDWTQDLSDTAGEKYQGNLDFTLVPSQETDNFFNALAIAFEPPKEWNKKNRQWWYKFDYVETYDAVKSGTYSPRKEVSK